MEYNIEKAIRFVRRAEDLDLPMYIQEKIQELREWLEDEFEAGKDEDEFDYDEE